MKSNAQEMISECNRPESSFKLKDAYTQLLYKQPEKVKIQEETVYEKVETHESIDEAKVMVALDRYIVESNPEQMVATALKAHQPLIKGESVTILVDNQLQIDKLETIKMSFHNFLIKTLNNGSITLAFGLFDVGKTTELKKYYTSQEKFEHFVELNPVVDELKQLFGLELD